MGIAVLRITDENFIWDISNLVRAKTSSITSQNADVLINLANTSKYLKDFRGNEDYYEFIHNEATRVLENG